MKQRRNRLQHQEASAEAEWQRAEVRAAREELYARRRGEKAEAPEIKHDTAPASPVTSVEIPKGWRELHWKKRAGIAKTCFPGTEYINGADADEAIERYIGGGS